MKWLRLYQDVLRNPKVQDLRPELFKFWINFLCVAGESRTRGTIPSEAHLRLALGLGKALVKRWCGELEALLLLQRNPDGSLTPHDWDDYQRASDDEAANKKAQRARTSVNGPPELSKDMSPDTSPDMSDHVLPRGRSDSEGEREEEIAAAASHARTCDPPPPEYPKSNCPYVIHPGGHAIDEAVARDLWRLLWEGWGDRRLCVGFYERQRFHSAETWRRAIAEAATRAVSPKGIRYLELIAADLEAAALAMPIVAAARPAARATPSGGGFRRLNDEEKAAVTRRLKERTEQYDTRRG